MTSVLPASVGRVLALAAALLLLPLAPVRAQDLFLAGGRLVEPAAETVRDAGLLIEGGVIRGTMDAPPEGFRGEVLDATGRWIVPGLHDLHVHSLVNRVPSGGSELLGTEVAARRMLYAGVTGFLDLFNEEDYVLGLRERLRGAGDPPAADLFAAGPCFTATEGHCTQYPAPTRTIDSPEEARREIAELADKRPDVVKVVYDGRWMPTIDEETLAAALEAAAEQGLPSVVHFGTWDEARAAVSAGATAVTHVRAAELPPDLPALLAERGTHFIPTLTAAQGLLPGDEGSVVVLEASPIADIENTERIAAVVHHGVVIDREALAAGLFPGVWSLQRPRP